MVLPAIKVRMAFQIRLPSVFHGGFEGDDQHALGPQLFSKLVGGKGLAKAHFGVPEEARCGLLVLSPDAVEIGKSFVHCGFLLCAGWEVLIAGACDGLAFA